MPAADTFRGIRVLDLGENIAGPFACMTLADLGADVVKVERIGTGDATRSLPPRTPADESTVFLAFNRNKRSIALDLAATEDVGALMQVARDVDVVVTSFRPGVAEKLGLGFGDFAAVSPSVIYCAISAFGDGPLGRERIGYDALVQAFSGMMDLTGEPNGRPVRAAASVVDMTTGMWAAMGIMAALARRPHVDGAQQVRPVLLDSALTLLAHQISGVRGAGVTPPRLGAAAPSAAPYDAWPTATGEIMIAAVTDRHFQRLCKVLGLDEAAADQRYATADDRTARRDELTALIASRLATGSAEHWCAEIAAAGVPVSPVNDLASALADPLTVERGVLTTSDAHPAVPQLRTPLDDGTCPLRVPPRLGEHTREVLLGAGVDSTTVDRIAAAAHQPGSSA
jgi:crotonobetainyl-CoA:carnitine CoA-transferase CaiB-like acyl-CoA transferase